MFQNLLETKPKKIRSTGGMVMSVILHTIMIDQIAPVPRRLAAMNC